jgi:uncharacterized phage protein gp47/JayE
VYIDLSYVQNQAYGTTATGEYLDMKVAERGLERHSATKEVCVLKCNLSTLEVGFQFADSSNNTWTLTSGVIYGPDADNLYEYRITCQTEGSIPEPDGDLRPLEFIAGLVTATFGRVISPGEDQESDTSLRKRYEESLIEIAFAGNVAAYREKMLELEYPINGTTATIGALQVYACTNAEGEIEGGNVKIWIVNSDLKPASAALVASVQEAICPMYNGEAVGLGNGFAPIGAAVHIATATSTPVLTINIQITIDSSLTTLQAAIDKIKANVKSYLESRLVYWGTQVKTPYDTAKISIMKAFIVAASLVTGVTNVLSVSFKKDNTSYPIETDEIDYETNGEEMEWLIVDDAVINVTL